MPGPARGAPGAVCSRCRAPGREAGSTRLGHGTNSPRVTPGVIVAAARPAEGVHQAGALRVWLSLGIVFLWVSLLSQWCHAFLLAPMRHPEDVLHPLQRTYPLHAGLITAVMGFVALCATRLAYWAR